MKWSNPLDNFWNVVTHLFAIFLATYFWSTDIGHSTVIFVEKYIPREELNGTGTLHQWFSGIFTTNTPVLITFFFYLVFFLILLEIIYYKKLNIRENSNSASIVLSIGNLAFNINTLLLIYSCFAISLPVISFLQGIDTHWWLLAFGIVTLTFYFIFACFHRYAIDKFCSYIRSVYKFGM
jgi:hypothetical protein